MSTTLYVLLIKFNLIWFNLLHSTEFSFYIFVFCCISCPCRLYARDKLHGNTEQARKGLCLAWQERVVGLTAVTAPNGARPDRESPPWPRHQWGLLPIRYWVPNRLSLSYSLKSGFFPTQKCRIPSTHKAIRLSTVSNCSLEPGHTCHRNNN